MNEYIKVHFSEDYIAFWLLENKEYSMIISFLTKNGIRFYDNRYSYILYDLCALALLQEEYFNNTNIRKESIDKEYKSYYDKYKNISN